MNEDLSDLPNFLLNAAEGCRGSQTVGYADAMSLVELIKKLRAENRELRQQLAAARYASSATY